MIDYEALLVGEMLRCLCKRYMQDNETL